jgi:hypothetical protein
MLSIPSTCKEMIDVSAWVHDGQTAKKGEKVSSDVRPMPKAADPAGMIAGGTAANDVSVDLSASPDVFSAVDSFFNMGKSNRLDDFDKLSPKDKEQFVMMVAELAKSGYVGYEELVVDHKVERHDLATQVGDRRLHDARVYDSAES